MNKKTKVFLLENWPKMIVVGAFLSYVVFMLIAHPPSRQDWIEVFTMLAVTLVIIVAAVIFSVLIALYHHGIDKANELREELEDEE